MGDSESRRPVEAAVMAIVNELKELSLLERVSGVIKDRVAPGTMTSVPQCCTVSGPLFEAVQRNRLFKDSKTFVDCELQEGVSQEELVEAFQRAMVSSNSNSVKLVDFVNQKWFVFPAEERPRRYPPVAGSVGTLTDPVDRTLSLEQHIESMWDHLTLSFSAASPSSTTIPLPAPVVVPGGRFREVYYWDSFFTGLGLVAAGRTRMLLNMLDNFTSLIHRFGYIPNGNRTYYLGRSQPPYYLGMVKLVEKQGVEVGSYMEAVEKEYHFWMQGLVDLNSVPSEDPLSPSASSAAASGRVPAIAAQRVVKLPCGAILNRYWDPSGEPRPESYWNDLELLLSKNDDGSHQEHGVQAHSVQGLRYGGPEHEALFRNIRAAAESGWDFSTRWTQAGHTDLSKTITTDLLPVDLNVLLWEYEDALANWYFKLSAATGSTASTGSASGEAGDAQRQAASAAAAYQEKAEMFRRKSEARRAAIHKIFWDQDRGWFFDYNARTQHSTGIWALSGMYPLAYGVAAPAQAMRCEGNFLEKFLQPGGALTTWNPLLRSTGQQWDCPNGWAPLQYISFVGLVNYGRLEAALQLRERWMGTVERTYRLTGAVLEKYDVLHPSASGVGGGGEYECQEGFGWTNGVHLALSNLQHWCALHGELYPSPEALLRTPRITGARRASLGLAIALDLASLSAPAPPQSAHTEPPGQQQVDSLAQAEGGNTRQSGRRRPADYGSDTCYGAPAGMSAVNTVLYDTGRA